MTNVREYLDIFDLNMHVHTSIIYIRVFVYTPPLLYRSIRDVERSKMLAAGGSVGVGHTRGDGEGTGALASPSADLSLKQGEKIKISIGGGKVTLCLVSLTAPSSSFKK